MNQVTGTFPYRLINRLNTLCIAPFKSACRFYNLGELLAYFL
jgi:hypothetical protein